MKYNIKLFCGKQSKVFNFQSNLSRQELACLFEGIVKKEYSYIVNIGYKKKRGAPVTLEQVLLLVRNYRFYVYILRHRYNTEFIWKEPFSIDFKIPIHIDSIWIADWGGTFFKLCTNTELLNVNFEELKILLNKYGIDLIPSKTEGIWFSHHHLEITTEETKLIFRKRTTKVVYEEYKEKVEL